MPQRTFYVSAELDEQLRERGIDVGDLCRRALRHAVACWREPAVSVEEWREACNQPTQEDS